MIILENLNELPVPRPPTPGTFMMFISLNKRITFSFTNFMHTVFHYTGAFTSNSFKFEQNKYALL